MVSIYLEETRERMDKALDNFVTVLQRVRTGRATVNILDPVTVEYYGMPTPLNQIAGISVVEGKQLLIKPFDPTSLKAIEKGIFEANINLTPLNDGVVIRINVPALNEETRRDLTKQIGKHAEEAKVNIRNIRREQNEVVKKADELTEDFEKNALEDIQKITDEFIKKIDELAQNKSKEIMTV